MILLYLFFIKIFLKCLKISILQNIYATKPIDTVQRKIAFTTQTIADIIIFDLSDIRSWSMVTQTNTIQRSDGTEISRDHYSIVVNTNNADQPMFSFFAENYYDAKSWIARLSAIIKG